MSVVALNEDVLRKVAALISNPAGALPSALKVLAPAGQWDLLTQKVGSNLAVAGKSELVLPLLDKSATKDGALSSDWTWSASVEAAASLTLDLLAQKDLEALPFRPDAGHTLIAYGAAISAGGRLGVNADSLPWGKVGIDASGQRSADVRWYVQGKDDGTLLQALDSAKSHFVWPHDIQAMLRMAGRTDWFGMAYELAGEGQIALQVDAGWQGAGWTFSTGGETSSVGLSIGLKAGFQASRKSRWKLSATVEAPPGEAGGVLGLRVRLHDTKQSTRSASVELAAGADFSAVAASAERALRAAWPELQKSALLDALTQPGTAIATELRQLIDDKLDGSLKELVGVLVGGEPTDALRASLVDKLTFGLADVLDGALGDVAAGRAQASQLVRTWLQRLLGSLADSMSVDEHVEAVIADALAKATAGLEGAIGTIKTSIVGKATSEVDAFLGRLGELGAQFERKLDQLDDNRASVAIREALARYSTLRDKLLGALADSHRQKLILTLGATYSRTTAQEAAFEAWFRPDDMITAEAERLFNALHAGRLLALPELLAAAAGIGAVTDAKGWLLSTRKTLEDQRVTLNFFGVQIASRKTWLRDVAVRTDLVSGNLIAVKAIGSVETEIVNPWKNRRARLGVQLDLVDAGSPARRLSVSLEGAFTASNENTDRGEVQSLVNDYADAVGAQRSDVGQVLDIPPDAEGAHRFWKALTIALPVALDATQWARFASIDAEKIERVSLECALAQFHRRYVTDALFSKDPARDLRELILQVTNVKKADDAAILGYLKRFPERYVNSFSAADAAEKVGIRPTTRGGRIFMAYQRLSVTVQAPLRLRDLAAEAAARVQGLPEHPDPQRVRELLDPVLARMQAALSPVALVSETWLGVGLFGAKDEPVSWPFASFITTMARLVGLPVPPGFPLIAQAGDTPPMRLLSS